MSGPVFYIGLGLGLAAACGLRPFLPLLLSGALASANALEVDFSHDPYRFLRSGWWLLAVTVTLVLAYALQLLLGLSPFLAQAGAAIRGRRPEPLAAALAGLGLGAGALLFAGTLADHGALSWPGLIGGVLAAGLTQRAVTPIIAGARARLPDRAAREALTVYMDAASLVLAALVALLHPLGYVAVALLGWLYWRGRSRGGERHAGLRILGR
ncbi:MAG TPA: DUF4126 family protein [Solirubrobacteraceae bacterium]|nr:DUF4126 family protein [Solirubrobacteraceae bacterium]